MQPARGALPRRFEALRPVTPPLHSTHPRGLVLLQANVVVPIGVPGVHSGLGRH